MSHATLNSPKQKDKIKIKPRSYDKSWHRTGRPLGVGANTRTARERPGTPTEGPLLLLLHHPSSLALPDLACAHTPRRARAHVLSIETTTTTNDPRLRTTQTQPRAAGAAFRSPIRTAGRGEAHQHHHHQHHQQTQTQQLRRHHLSPF
jgi:hypothetical protein